MKLWYIHMWEFWAASTKSNFQGLCNDIGNVLSIMLSSESGTLAGVQNVQPLRSEVWQPLLQHHAHEPSDPAILPLETYSKDAPANTLSDTHTHRYSHNISCNRRRVGTAQTPISR